VKQWPCLPPWRRPNPPPAPQGLLERLAIGPVICDGGFVFALEKWGYIKVLHQGAASRPTGRYTATVSPATGPRPPPGSRSTRAAVSVSRPPSPTRTGGPSTTGSARWVAPFAEWHLTTPLGAPRADPSGDRRTLLHPLDRGPQLGAARGRRPRGRPGRRPQGRLDSGGEEWSPSLTLCQVLMANLASVQHVYGVGPAVEERVKNDEGVEVVRA
jgi:hypothetical protein